MAGLVPAIHVFEAERLLIKTWMPGTGPGMTSFFDAEGLATVVIARSDEAIQLSAVPHYGLLRFARSDGFRTSASHSQRSSPGLTRLDRAIQYSVTFPFITSALEYWITRFRG